MRETVTVKAPPKQKGREQDHPQTREPIQKIAGPRPSIPAYIAQNASPHEKAAENEEDDYALVAPGEALVRMKREVGVELRCVLHRGAYRNRGTRSGNSGNVGQCSGR